MTIRQRLQNGRWRLKNAWWHLRGWTTYAPLPPQRNEEDERSGQRPSTENVETENVEIVRRAFEYEVYGRGDREEVLAGFDADVVLNRIEEGPSRGRDAVRDRFERWSDAWDELGGEFIDSGDRVVVARRWRGRRRASGIQVEVYTLRDGKIVRIDEFIDRAEALAAAGVPE
jgi:ketosteroid isomerase-like protein